MKNIGINMQNIDTWRMQQVLDDDTTLYWERKLIEDYILNIDRYGEVIGYKYDPRDIIIVMDRIISNMDMDVKDAEDDLTYEPELDFSTEEE